MSSESLSLSESTTADVDNADEDVHSMLFWFIVVFAWTFAFAPMLIKMLLQPFFKESEEEHGISIQVAEIKVEMKSINRVDEFAKYAKLQRKINKLNEEMKNETNTRLANMVKIKVAVNAVFYVLNGLMLLFILWNYRKSPVIIVDAAWLFPLNRILSYPSTCEAGAVSAMIWLAICIGVAKTTARKFS